MAEQKTSGSEVIQVDLTRKDMSTSLKERPVALPLEKDKVQDVLGVITVILAVVSSFAGLIDVASREVSDAAIKWILYLVGGFIVTLLSAFAVGLWFNRRRPKGEELRQFVTAAYLGTLDKSALNPKSGVRLVFRSWQSVSSDQRLKEPEEMYTVAAPRTAGGV